MAAFFFGVHQQCLDGLLNRQLELLYQLGDGLGVRRINNTQFFAGGRARLSRCHCFCQFDIGGKVRTGREHDIVFTAVGQYLELV
ncbi:hypothetical protein D3C79_1054570 [compost metagenome]